MNIQEMEGRELDEKVSTELMGRLWENYSRYIDDAWQVDKPGWFWSFFETPIYLQVTLYPSREIWDKRPWDLQPIPDEIITIKVNWDECKTKAEAYALGRCRVAVMAVEAE